MTTTPDLATPVSPALQEEARATLRRLAARWVATHAARPAEIRIDLVGVLRPSRGAAVVEHVRGAV